MYRKISDFTTNYANEAKATIKMFSAINDASLNQSVNDGHRTIGRIAWHIITTIPEMMSQTGLSLKAVAKDAPVPATIDEIIETYKSASEELLEAVKTNWNDESLLTEDKLYGDKWNKGKTLDILIGHETHHRGQLTILMRQAGLIVPGIFGPAKEEWANLGAPSPAI